MKGKIKKTLLGVAALAFAFAGVGSLATYQAKASTPALFEMVEGASVRTATDTSGIRFSFRVNSDQQTALSGYKAVEYGMLITQESEATIDEIYNAGEAVFAENGEWSFNKDDIATKKFVANITGTTLVDEKDEQGELTGNKLFNAALTNISQTNFTATYVGVGYIKTTSEGATDSADDDVVAYHFATKNDNERTITYVAEKAIANGDENAVGNAVVENYVSGGYANLGLTVEDTEEDAGTETNPYLVEVADYDSLKNATANALIYGVDKCMKFAEGVDYSSLATDFANRNYVFVWDGANVAQSQEGNQVELFNAPSHTAAAYYQYQGQNVGKKEANTTSAYHDEFNGHYGVVSFKSSDYYWNQITRYTHNTTGEVTVNTKPSDYDSNTAAYTKTVTTNDFTMDAELGHSSRKAGWNYHICSASSYNHDGSTGDDNWTDVDYISFWLYVDGTDGETVKVTEWYNRQEYTVNCNEWTEIRWDKHRTTGAAWFKSFFQRASFKATNRTYTPLFMIADQSVTSAYDQENVYNLSGNRTVYVDDLMFCNYPTTDLTVAKVEGESKAKITATLVDGVENVTYTAKTPMGKSLTVNDDLTFDTGLVGTYTVTVSATLYGREVSSSTTYTVAATELMSEMELEGFYSADCLVQNGSAYPAVWGATNTGTVDVPVYTVSKSTSANNAAWHESVKDSADVTKYGVVSMTSAHPSAYGNVYYVGSSVRPTSFHNPGESYAIGIDWDYVSMWIYIAGEDGQSVKVSGSNDFDEREVPFNTWYEYRVYKAYFVKTNWNRPSYTLGYGSNSSWDSRSMLYVGEKNDTNDYTVYVDSLTYVNAEDAMDIQATASTTQGTAGTVSFTITPKAGYETTLANAQYTTYLHMFADTSSKGELVYKNNAYTYQTSTTHVWIVVRVEIDGVSYVSDVMYEIPTASESAE